VLGRRLVRLRPGHLRRRRAAELNATADLLDEHPDALVCVVQFRSFGAPAFHGPIATVSCLEDNVLVRRQLESAGNGRVLVVDGGGSLRCALLGDRLAELGVTNGWAGVVLNACVRDSVDLIVRGFGVKAIGTSPRPSTKTAAGEVDVPVTFGEVTFEPGALLYADEDGVIVLPSAS
jgi:regulator of ribonuclease activity A